MTQHKPALTDDGMKLYADPKFWVRLVSDGEGWEPPIHHSGMTTEMIKSGRYTPLYIHPMPVDHIPDIGQMVPDKQPRSLDESQAKIISAVQSYADTRVMAVYGRASAKDVHEAYWNLSLRMQAELAITQEPFAWFIDDKRVCGNRVITDSAVARDWLDTDPDKVTPLYTHPCQINNLADGTVLDEGTKEPYQAAAPKYTVEKTIEQHRSEFELWGKTMANWIGERNHFDEYSCQTEQFCWLAWKAALGITE